MRWQWFEYSFSTGSQLFDACRGIDASCDGYYTLRGEQNMRAMGWLGGERAHGGVEALDEREPAVAARGVGFGVERRSSGGEF